MYTHIYTLYTNQVGRKLQWKIFALIIANIECGWQISRAHTLWIFPVWSHNVDLEWVWRWMCKWYTWRPITPTGRITNNRCMRIDLYILYIPLTTIIEFNFTFESNLPSDTRVKPRGSMFAVAIAFLIHIILTNRTPESSNISLIQSYNWLLLLFLEWLSETCTFVYPMLNFVHVKGISCQSIRMNHNFIHF